MGEGKAAAVILSILLVLALGGAGYLYHLYDQEKKAAKDYEQSYHEAKDRLLGYDKVIIDKRGETSHPAATTLTVSGEATYAYEYQGEGEASIGVPKAEEGQSDFSLCYTLTDENESITISLKNAYNEEFYAHCAGNYAFPVMVDGEDFAEFELNLMPGPMG